MRRRTDDDNVALDERLRDALPTTAVYPLRPSAGRVRKRALLQPLAWVGRPEDNHDIEALRRASRLLDSSDRLGPGVLAIRWGAVGVSFVLAIDELAAGRPAAVAWALLLVVIGALRLRWPVRFDGSVRTVLEIAAEAAVPILATLTTGYWTSPLVPALTVPVAVTGFGLGLLASFRTAVLASTIVTGTSLIVDPINHSAQLSLEWSAVLVLMALIAGHARHLTGEVDNQRTAALDRVERLTDANALLYSLHRVAQTLPASLDLGEVLDTTVSRLRGLFDFDAVTLLLFDETDAAWHVLRADGLQLALRLGPTDLPPSLKRAIAENSLVEVRDLSGPAGPGLSPRARSGMYTVMLARGSLIGLLALESDKAAAFAGRDVELLNGFVEPAALAIDNARWFSRLRTVGADEERTRIARDLHDRIGQSLAYLGFELDRIISRDCAGEPVTGMLADLRDNVRTVIGEVRETLYDLRTDVSDSSDLVDTLDRFTERFRVRSGLELRLQSEYSCRLPILQERELWRIAQEALVNVERHADATSVSVRWRSDGSSALLEIADDGRGFLAGSSGRVDSYGILGMRERAASIGATLDIESEPAKGTVVRCLLRP